GSPYGSLVWIGGPDRPPGARSPSVASLGYPDIPESHGNYGCPMNALRAGLADPSGGPQVWDRDRRDREMPDREIPGREGPDRGWQDLEWQQWRRPGPTAEQRRHDLWLGLGIMLVAVITAVLVNSTGAFTFGEAPSLTEQLIWAVALTAPLIWRRRYPEAVVIVVAALFIAAQARRNGDNLLPSVALFMALYSLGAWGRNRVVARWVRIGVIVAMFGWLAINFGRA